MSLKELMRTEIPTVYGATKREQATTEVPASVTVVDADEIRRYGYRTLGELLRSVQGLYVTYDRNYQFLGIRGFNRGDYNSRVLLLVDGHRLNNGLSDGAYIDTAFLLDVDLIEKVEIIRGPGSVLYGNNALFGVINVVTRRGADIHGLEVSGWGGSLETGRGRITYGNKFKNDLEVVLSGSLYESQGQERLFYKEFNSPDFNNGVAENGDHDRFKSLFGSVAYHGFTLEGGYIWREKGNPTAPFAAYGAVFNDPRTSTIDERSYASLKYTNELP
jgi:iron complex outermembrane receptor protein